MGVISGMNGIVNGIGNITKWTVALSNDLQQAVTSATGGATVQVRGNNDWSGSFDATGYEPALRPGATSTFIGEIGNANGIEGPIMATDFRMTIDIAGGKIIRYSQNFGGNGAPTSLNAVTALDTAEPFMPTAIGTVVQLGTAVASPVYTPMDDVQTVEINFTRDNKNYVSSSTGGENKRVKGNLSGTISISVLMDNLTDLPVRGTYNAVKITNVDASFWELLYVEWGDISNITTDVEGANVIGATLNGKWTAYIETDEATPIEGAINMPSTVSLWPAGSP